MNKIIVSGNLTRDPEYNETNGGKAYVRMSIAVNRQFSKVKAVDFFNLVAWEKTALFCSKYLKKGDRIIAEGRLNTDEYEDKAGNKRIAYDIIIDNVEFAGKKKDAETTASEGESEDTESTAFEDLPF